MPDAAATALLSGQVAMVMDGTWDLLTIGITKEQQGLDFGVGVLPYMKKLATTSVGTPIVVYKSTKHLPEALTLLEFVMNPENSLPLLQSGIWLPNEKQWYTDPKLLSQWIDNPRHPPEYKTAVVDFAAQLLAPASPVLRADFLEDGRRDRGRSRPGVAGPEDRRGRDQERDHAEDHARSSRGNRFLVVSSRVKELPHGAL